MFCESNSQPELSHSDPYGEIGLRTNTRIDCCLQILTNMFFIIVQLLHNYYF